MGYVARQQIKYLLACGFRCRTWSRFSGAAAAAAAAAATPPLAAAAAELPPVEAAEERVRAPAPRF